MTENKPQISIMQARRRKRKELVQGYTLDYLRDHPQWCSIYDIWKYIEWDCPHKKRLTIQSLTMLIAPLVWNGTIDRKTLFIGTSRQPCYILSQFNDSTDEEE
jgi:hypothetical protein